MIAAKLFIYSNKHIAHMLINAEITCHQAGSIIDFTDISLV